MDTISMENAFAVTKLVQQADPRYLYCHVLGHNLSYKEAEQHPDQWMDIITRCPTTMCNNGCLHGALMRRFNRESLTDKEILAIKPDLETVCEPRDNWKPVEVERSMCYHSLGHLAMYMTDGNISKSASLCEEIGHKSDGRNYTQTCSEGVLMTVFQPLEPEDFALVRDITPKKEGVSEFCNQFVGEIYHACMRESWPRFIDEIRSPEGLNRFCSYSNDPNDQRKCLGTTLNILTQYLVIDSNNNIQKLSDYCSNLYPHFQSECFAASAARLIQIDPSFTNVAVQVCTAAEAQNVGADCYERLMYHAGHSFHLGSKERLDYCNAFTEPWKKRCLIDESGAETQ
jgi:hypothetical protein